VPPPYAGAIVDHERFFGLNAKIPYATSSLVEVQLGWGSHVWSLIPVSTNRIYASPISDTFRLGQGLNPFSTEIVEDLQAGWDGQPPPARLNIMAPHLPVEPMHSSVMQRQGRETVTISRQELDSLKGAEMLRQKIINPGPQ
jgi:hypothetical protein